MEETALSAVVNGPEADIVKPVLWWRPNSLQPSALKIANVNKTEMIALHSVKGVIGRVMPRGHSITTWTRRGGKGSVESQTWSCDKGY